MTIFLHDDGMYAPDEWHPRFSAVLSGQYGIATRLVDFHSMPLTQIASQVGPNDGLLARWGHVPADMERIGPIADAIATLFSGRIFPSPQSYLYYDDKARQASLFLNRGYPTPATAVVSNREEIEAFVARHGLSWPIVVKDAHGAGSSAVRLMDRGGEARFPCVVQQFCPGNDRDYRVNVIGHRVMGFARLNRDHDFRASGSGKLLYVEEIDPELIALAQRISDENGFDSMAYDFVRLDGRWVLLEMSYTYVDRAVRDCAYYYDTRSGARLPKVGVYPQDFIIEDFLMRHYPETIHAPVR